jgi:membrane-bound lytic murein transglycosylase B
MSRFPRRERVKKLILILILVFALRGYAEGSRLGANFLEKKDTLIEVLVKAQIDDAPILFSDARLELYPQLLEMSANGSGWEVIFTRESVDRGRKCLKENEAILRRVEARFGVNREILVSLFRVETNLGKDTGRYVVFNSLLTWYVSGNRRASWAANELISYLTLCRAHQLDPFEVKGSSHGAFGLLQFIPSSFQRFAIDGNGDGKIDLFNFEDAMASSANYLQKNGWGKKEKQKKSALHAYNRDWGYVKTIMKYSRLINGAGVRQSL